MSMEPFPGKLVLHAMACPRCGAAEMVDDQAGGLHCRNCGHEQQMGWDDPESWMEGKFDWDFNLPLEGMAQGDEMLQPGERNWVILTRDYGSRRQGATWHFANSTSTVHYNRWTGERCNCPWNDAHAKLTKLAGPNLNKVLKAPDKALHTPEGEEFKRVMAEKLGEERESLAPYLAHRFKKGDIRVGGDRDLPEDTIGGPHLQFWQHPTSLETFRGTPRKTKRQGELPQHTDQILKENENRYFNPLSDHVLANWHNWYEARQHPLRRGVNVLEDSWTPEKMDERARQHSEEVRREQQVEALSHSGKVIHKFEPHKGGVGIDWDSVWANEPHMTPKWLEDLHWAETFPQGVDPKTAEELKSLRDNYPLRLAPRMSGWHIKQLQNADDLRAEGTMMGHCIGNDEKYGNCLEHGLIDAYSLRDPKGRPHVTWHYNSDGSLAEIFGPNDDPVKPEYQNMLDEWGDQEGRNTKREEAVGHQEEDPEEDNEMGSFLFPQANDVEDYVRYHHPDHYHEYAGDAEDYEGRRVGENTEFEWEDPNWNHIGMDYLDKYKRNFHAPNDWSEESKQKEQERIDRQHERFYNDFHEAIKHHGAQGDMQEALQEHIDDVYGPEGERLEPAEQPDPDHVHNAQRWNEAFPSWEVNIPEAPSEEPELREYPDAYRVPPNPNADPWTYHRTDPTGGVFTKLPGEQPSGQRQLFSSTRSLYHGTLLDHLPSIQQHGLLPEVGPFVSDAYDLNEPSNFLAFSPEEIGVEPVAFMTDKKRLEKALNAIRFNVSQKLNKRWSDVTPNDVRNHGLLLKSKGEMGQQDPPMNYVWDERHEEPFEEGPRAHQPRGVAGEGPYQAEPGDYYSREPVGGLEYIHGPAMMRVFERHGLIPWWDPTKPSERQMPAAAQEVYGAWHFAMPVGEDYWQQWQRSKPNPKIGDPTGELYHGTSPTRLESIMRHGIYPWDSPIAGGTVYKDMPKLQPRPGHVYLSQDPRKAYDRGLDSSVEDLGPGAHPLVLKIDPAYLDPRHINPDEDNIPGIQGWVDKGDYPSSGAAAEAWKWGDLPSETEREMERGRSIGYRGVIPPEALTPGRYRNGEWTPLERTSAHFGSTMYHVAPAHAERAIAREGLRGDPETWDDMVWLHENEDKARAYAGPDEHVYAVDVTGMEGDPNHMLEPGMQHSWVAKGPIPPERIKRIAATSLIGEMRDGWGRFATAVPWQWGQWGKGIYYPETGTLQTWGDDRTHPEVALEDENAAQGNGHHIILRPNGTVKDQGAMNTDSENVEGDAPALVQALRELDPRLRLDKPSDWDFGGGPTEPVEEEPSSVSRGEDGGTIHGVQTGGDFAGSL